MEVKHYLEILANFLFHCLQRIAHLGFPLQTYLFFSETTKYSMHSLTDGCSRAFLRKQQLPEGKFLAIYCRSTKQLCLNPIFSFIPPLPEGS